MAVHNITSRRDTDDAFEKLDTKIRHARAIADLIAESETDSQNLSLAAFALEQMLQESAQMLSDYRDLVHVRRRTSS